MRDYDPDAIVPRTPWVSFLTLVIALFGMFILPPFMSTLAAGTILVIAWAWTIPSIIFILRWFSKR